MFRLAIAAAVLLSATPLLAETITVTQQNKKFSEKSVTIKAGDTIDFVNGDEHVHNVHSATEGNEFDMGAQKPGETHSHTFANAGKIKVRCAIHPKMKLTVEVTE